MAEGEAKAPSTTPRVVVFGGTGPTGRHLVEQALDKNWDVLAMVRSPHKLDDLKDRKNLKVVKADIMDSESLEPHLESRDAVFSCLGASDSWGILPVTFYSESMTSISDAMKKVGVNRLVVVTSWATVSKPGNPFLLEWILKPLLIGRHLTDMAKMEDYIRRFTEINYTFIVRPPGLTDGPKSDRAISEAIGQFAPNTEYQIRRADVATFMLTCLGETKYERNEVAIGYTKK